MRAAIDAFLLLTTANLVPWLLGKVLGRRGNLALDFGYRAWDGQRIFGSHKTWRGLVGGTLACGCVAEIIGHGFGLGVDFGAASLAGDAFSSAVKRRLRQEPGRQIPALDQLPEALLPLLCFAPALELSALGTVVVASAFTATDVLVRRLSHHD